MALSSLGTGLLAICPDTGIQSDDICPICVEEINPDAGYVNTHCGHKYCLECFCKYISFDNRLLNNSNCAVCRHPLQYNEGKPANPAHCKLKCGHVISYKSLCKSINANLDKQFKCRYCGLHYYDNYSSYNSNSASPPNSLRIFARNYNVLRMMSGLGGLSYSS
jgi:hypothetical protein